MNLNGSRKNLRLAGWCASEGRECSGHEGLEATCQDVEALGGTALVVPTDVAGFGQVESAAQAVEKAFGSIDI